MEYKTKVAVVYVVGLFMEIMDTTIVNVALPTLARDFGVGTDRIEWVVLGYLLSLAVWIPASGWLGDRFGTKKVFLFALATFTTASALCGLAGSLDQLIAFRVLQGVGGGMLTPVGAAMLYRAYPLAERARAATAVIGVAVVAPATGPVLGGLIVDTISWRWIFYVNVPLGLGAVVLGALLLSEHREPTAGPFDLVGFLASACALTLAVYGLSEGPRRGWTDTLVVAPLAVAVTAAVVLVVVETRHRAPMLDLSLLGERLFRQSNIVGIATYGGFVGLLFVFPLYLQTLRGFSALDSGLTQIPQAIGVMVFSQIVGRRLYPVLGPRRLLVTGLALGALVGWGFANIGYDTSLWSIRGLMFTRGAAMSLIFVSLQAATYAGISVADTGRASAIFSTQRQVASALGVAIAATVLTTGLSGAATLADPAARAARALDAYQNAFAATAVMFVVALVAATRIRDSDASATFRGPRPRPEPVPPT